MKNKIKFHSIYYRFYLFIILLIIGVAKFVSNGKPIKFAYSGYDFTISQNQLTYITFGVTLAVVAIFSVLSYKIYICKDGIYLRKIDLLVGWDEIDSLSHVWINAFTVRNGLIRFYNRKTLVIYRKGYKAICVYNISLLSLFVAKVYYHGIKTNILLASLATMFNVGFSGWVFYQFFFAGLVRMKLWIFLAWMALFFIKVLILPLIMTSLENKIHGDYLFHDTAYRKNASKTIHL